VWQTQASLCPKTCSEYLGLSLAEAAEIELSIPRHIEHMATEPKCSTLQSTLVEMEV